MRDAIMRGDGFRESLKRILDAFVSNGFIQLHEGGRAYDIGMQEDRKFACWFFGHENACCSISSGGRVDNIVGWWE